MMVKRSWAPAQLGRKELWRGSDRLPCRKQLPTHARRRAQRLSCSSFISGPRVDWAMRRGALDARCAPVTRTVSPPPPLPTPPSHHSLGRRAQVVHERRRLSETTAPAGVQVLVTVDTPVDAALEAALVAAAGSRPAFFLPERSYGFWLRDLASVDRLAAVEHVVSAEALPRHSHTDALLLLSARSQLAL